MLRLLIVALVFVVSVPSVAAEKMVAEFGGSGNFITPAMNFNSPWAVRWISCADAFIIMASTADPNDDIFEDLGNVAERTAGEGLPELRGEAVVYASGLPGEDHGYWYFKIVADPDEEETVAQFVGKDIQTVGPVEVEGTWELRWAVCGFLNDIELRVGHPQAPARIVERRGYGGAVGFEEGGKFYFRVIGGGDWVLQVVKKK